MNLVTTQEMAELDQRAQLEIGIPGTVLMEQAGIKGFHTVVEALNLSGTEQDPCMVFLSGGGNNGGDALVMAREAVCMGYRDVTIIITRETCNETVGLQRSLCRSFGIPSVLSTDPEAALLLERADIIFDGMIGTGLKGALRAGNTRDFISRVNGIEHAKKVAIDLPSGLSEQAGKSAVFFHADITVTFGLPKMLFYYPHIRLHCGDIHIVNPGYPQWLLQEYGAQRNLLGIDQVLCREIHLDSYKNSKGHLGVFAGSEGFTGAASLSSEAALRIHTGLVSLHVDDNIYTVLSSQLRSVMVKPLHGQVISRDELKERYSALLAGPGWGVTGREQQLREIVMSGLPVLLDADAITLLKQLLEQGAVDREKLNNVVLTPHPGEFFRLSGVRVSDEPQSVIDAVQKVAQESGCVIVYKSYINYIVEPDGRMTVMEGMNPAMGSAGSGDVLSGIIGGFLAQRYRLADAAVTGNAVHQRAGRLAKDTSGWFIAEDLLGFLGNVC